MKNIMNFKTQFLLANLTLSKVLILLPVLLIFISGCRPLPDATSLIIRLEIVDENDDPIPDAGINFASSTESFNQVVSSYEDIEPSPIWHWDELSDENGLAYFYPNIEISGFEKKDTIFFYVLSFHHSSSQLSDTLSNINSEYFYIVKKLNAKTHDVKVVLGP